MRQPIICTYELIVVRNFYEVGSLLCRDVFMKHTNLIFLNTFSVSSFVYHVPLFIHLSLFVLFILLYSTKPHISSESPSIHHHQWLRLFMIHPYSISFSSVLYYSSFHLLLKKFTNNTTHTKITL